MFRENLRIEQADLENIIALSDEEKVELIKKEFRLQLKMNGKAAEIKAVTINKIGISVEYDLKSPITERVFSLDIGFKMPQIIGHSEFLVSISEPTFEPTIIFTYDTSAVDVTAYQFLNSDPQLVDNSELIKGQYIIHPREWIYPVKGVVFIISDKERLN